MKKLFVIALAAIGMAACTQDELVEVKGGDAIVFDDAFLDNATRAAVDPSITTNTIDGFNVWAFMDEVTGTVFEKEEVTKSGDAWTYANTQYWTPNHTYYFAALAPVGGNWTLNTANANKLGAGIVNFINADGGEDLLYAKQIVTTPADINSQPAAVKLEFEHLLSKVKFTFENGFTNENAKLVVKDIKMTAPQGGSIDLAVADYAEGWNLNGTDATFAYGDLEAEIGMGAKAESANERLTVPAKADYKYTITFTVELYMGDQLAQTFNETTELTGIALEMGKAYNFTANLNATNLGLYPITFDVVVDDWDETASLDYSYEVTTGSVIVNNANGLQTVMAGIAAGTIPSDVNIILGGDIDLSAPITRAAAVESNWVPVGTEEKPFTGAFDGKGHTIKNLTIVESEAKEGKAYIGFFGYAKDAEIKNVIFENVTLNIACLDIDHSQGHIGAVAGSLEGTSTIENVTVKGDIKVEATQGANGASRVAVVAGGNSYGNVTMKNVHVIANEGSYLIANNNTGALAGQLQGKNVFENCSSNIDVTVNKFFAGGIIGLAAGDSQFINCHTTGDIAVVAGRSGKAHDHYRVGGIAGGWADGAKNVCTLVNCSYTGELTGVNSDGSVADKFDYLGYVGRGYTLNGCAGSKVVIDGIEFIQVGNTAAEAGVYTVTNAEGEEVVAAGSKEDLPKTDDGTMIDTNFDEDTTLFGDITLSASETNANSGYAATGVKVSNGAVLDGKGNTLTVEDANSTWACCVAVTGGTIKNLTVAGAMRGIFMPGADGDVYIDNVIFKDVVYTFNSDAGNKNYGVYISNCTINGWTSHSDVHKEVVYTNCSFGEGNSYAYCRPYGPTSFVDCDFEAGFAIDARGEVTFENCRLDGVQLTSSNIGNLVVSNVGNVKEVK